MIFQYIWKVKRHNFNNFSNQANADTKINEKGEHTGFRRFLYYIYNMKDFIVSKSFNSSVSYTENMSRAILNFEKVYNPCSFGFDYCEQLFPRIKQKYNLVKAIGEKENYSEKEAKAINNFFTFAVGSNVFALDGKLKYKYFITNAINHTSTSTVDYYVGTPDFYVPAHIQCYCSKTNQKNFAVSITVEAKPLNNEQMKKFIKLLNDYTFETFSIGFYQEREAC